MSLPTFQAAGTAGQPGWNPGQALYIQNPDGSFTHLSPGQLTHIEQTNPAERIFSSNNATQPVTTVADQMASQADQLSAKGIITQTLANYGLEDLGSWAWQQYLASGSTDYVLTQLPTQPQFQAIYPAYNQLAKEGRGISIAQYHDYNNQMVQLAQKYGVPDGFMDANTVGQMLLAGKDTAEVDTDLQDYADALTHPDVQARLTQFGLDPTSITPGALAAFFTDPKKAQPLLERQFTAAQIGAATDRAGVSVSSQEALGLAGLGITGQQARTDADKLGTLAPLLTPLPGSPETQISNDTAAQAVFGSDANAERLLTQRQDQRIAPFKAGGGFVRSTKGGGQGFAAGA